MNTRISENVQVLPPERAIEILPYAIVEFMLGTDVIGTYRNGDGVAIIFDGRTRHLAKQDFELVKDIALALEGELGLGRIPSPKEVLRLHERAAVKVREALADRVGEKREKAVAMLKDKGSSGWWRMVLPARVMSVPGWRLDCTAAAVDFDNLLAYDTIFVQRVHDWDSYYVLERLKRIGKRIVYDIDDDLFNITPDNPAYNTITRDDQIAAAKCIKLANAVTVTTEELRRRIAGVVEGVDPIVIPNAMDLNDRWLPTTKIGSPDFNKRIFWSGGASHGADWGECFEAVKRIMAARDNVLLVILGWLPTCVEREAFQMPFKGRIEFLGFNAPDTYYELIHHVRADVALAPVRKTAFNQAKSPIKFLEYSLIGIPTVATNWLPYSCVIDDKESGRLVNTTEEWEEAILSYLDDPKLRFDNVVNARMDCHDKFYLKDAAAKWAEVLCRENLLEIVDGDRRED